MNIKLHDIYRFYYNHPLEGQLQCYPSNGFIEWGWKKEKDQVFHRKQLNTTLVFVKEDFKKIHELERSGYKCDKIHFTIEKNCNGIWSTFWEGFLALVDGEYDVNKCRLELAPRLQDQYSCFLLKWDKEKDFIADEGAPESVGRIKTREGTMEVAICSREFQHPRNPPLNVEDFPPETDCLTDPGTYLWVENKLTWLGVWSIGLEIDISRIESFFVREIKSGTCSGSTPIPPEGQGWELIINNCPLSSFWARVPANNGLVYDFSFKNGRRLTDVIQFFLEACGLELQSDFFNHLAQGDVPDNAAYQYAEAFLKDLIIFQNSDIKKKGIGESATKAKTTLKKILESLRHTFNVYWVIEEDVFRLEHISYWKQQNLMLDLTQEYIYKYIRGKYKYKYAVDELPVQELWKWSIETDGLGGDFDGLPIEYKEPCSYGEEGKDVEYNSEFFTNLFWVINNTDDFPNSGFTLVASKNEAVITTVCNLSGEEKLNGPLSWANLLPALHTYSRPHKSGLLNNAETAFKSTRPVREQNDLIFPILCEDLNTFDPKDMVRSQLGWGEVSEAKLRDPGSTMTLNLLHN